MGLIKISATEINDFQPMAKNIEMVNNIRDKDIIYTDDMPEITAERAKNMMTPLEFQERLKQIHAPTKAFDDDVIDWVSKQDTKTKIAINNVIRQFMTLQLT
ncbi:MAG: hypothetical protein KGV51_04140 [Moraxellaceae bacterium]|nr:hypothetical protein [Moraxellaceae bacterium]